MSAVKFLKRYLTDKNLIPHYKLNYYRKQTIVLLIVLSVPALLIGSTIYFVSRNQLQEELMAYHDQQLKNQAEYFDSQMRNLEVNLNYWSYESLFVSSLDAINFQKEFQLAEEINSSLFSKQNGNSLIERIHLFVNSEPAAVFNPQYHWVENAKELEVYKTYLNHDTDFYWSKRQSDSNPSLFFPLVLVKNIPSYQLSGNANGASLIIELDRQAIINMLEGLSLSSKGMAFLVELESGTVMSNNQDQQRFYDQYLNGVSESISDDEALTIQGVDYSIRKGTFNRVDSTWEYISVVPLSSITAPITELSIVIVVTSLIVLLISLFMAMLTFRSLYSPIERLFYRIRGQGNQEGNDFMVIESNWERLNEEKFALEYHADRLNEKLVSNLFFQLIEGYLSEQTERDIKLQLKQYNITLTDQLVTYIDVETESKRYQNQLFQLLESEFPFQHIVIEFNERFFGLVVITLDKEEVKVSVENFFSNITRDNNFGLVKLYISQSVYQVIEIPKVVEQIRQQKYKATELSHSQLIFMPNQIKTAKNLQVMYPFDIEEKIIDAIEKRDSSAIDDLIERFVARLKEDDEGSVQYGFIQLYGSIQTHILKHEMDPLVICKGKNILKEILQSYHLDRLEYLVKDCLIEPYIKKLEMKLQTKQEYVVKELLDYIHGNYHQDISLDEVAKALDLNSYTVSRLFKQGKGENFIDYLTSYRIEKAKVMLVNTNLKIQEIAKAVGYQHSYFNRIFKKHVGLTPGKFRDIKQN